MKITLLAYVEKEGDHNCDVVMDEVAAALRQAGHTPSILCVHGDIRKLIAGLTRRKPDLVFNLLEQFGDGMLGSVEATGVLGLLNLPHTGGGAGEIYLQEDKALAKRLLSAEGINSADYAVFSLDADLETGGQLRMPLFVKPLRMDASIGIDASQSLVQTTAQLMEQVHRIHQELHDAALCEQYIPGREFYVGVLGNRQPQALAPIEVDFSNMPEGAPHVMDSKAKFDEKSPEYQGSKPVIAEIPSELRAKLQQVAVAAYRALRVRDYGRIDLRLTESGEIYVIEVNANCYLKGDSEFAMAAAHDGIDYPTLIGRIVDLAWQRHQERLPAPRKRRH